MITAIDKELDLVGHSSAIYGLVAGSDKNYCYTAGGDGALLSWDLASQEPARKIAQVNAPVYALARIAENRLLAGDNTGMLYALDLDEKKLLWQLKLQGSIFSILHDAHAGCHWIGLAGGHLLKIEEGRVAGQHQPCEGHIRSMLLFPESRTAAIGSSDGSLRLFNLDTAKVLHEISAHEHSTFSLASGELADGLYSGGRDAYLKKWSFDMKEGIKERLAVPAHLLTLNKLVLSPDGTYLASASRDKEIRIWESETLLLRKVLNPSRDGGHTHSVNNVIWPSQERIISVGDDRRLLSWKISYVLD